MLAVSPEPGDKFEVYVDRAANALTCVTPNAAYVREVIDRLAGVLAKPSARVNRKRWLVELEEARDALDDIVYGGERVRDEINALREVHAHLHPRSAESFTERFSAARSRTARPQRGRRQK